MTTAAGAFPVGRPPAAFGYGPPARQVDTSTTTMASGFELVGVGRFDKLVGAGRFELVSADAERFELIGVACVEIAGEEVRRSLVVALLGRLFSSSLCSNIAGLPVKTVEVLSFAVIVDLSCTCSGPSPLARFSFRCPTTADPGVDLLRLPLLTSVTELAARLGGGDIGRPASSSAPCTERRVRVDTTGAGTSTSYFSNARSRRCCSLSASSSSNSSAPVRRRRRAEEVEVASTAGTASVALSDVASVVVADVTPISASLPSLDVTVAAPAVVDSTTPDMSFI